MNIGPVTVGWIIALVALILAIILIGAALAGVYQPGPVVLLLLIALACAARLK